MTEHIDYMSAFNEAFIDAQKKENDYHYFSKVSLFKDESFFGGFTKSLLPDGEIKVLFRELGPILRKVNAKGKPDKNGTKYTQVMFDDAKTGESKPAYKAIFTHGKTRFEYTLRVDIMGWFTNALAKKMLAEVKEPDFDGTDPEAYLELLKRHEVTVYHYGNKIFIYEPNTAEISKAVSDAKEATERVVKKLGLVKDKNGNYLTAAQTKLAQKQVKENTESTHDRHSVK